MGKTENGLLRKTKGTVGQVVLSNGKGPFTIVRIKPEKSTKPPKQSQIEQRAKFALVTSFLGNFTDIIDAGYQSSNPALSPMNQAVKYHLLNAVTGTYPNFQMDPSKVILSNGKLRGTFAPSITASEHFLVTVTWNSADDYNTDQAALRAKDTAALVVFNPVKKLVAVNQPTTRGDNKLMTTIPRLFSGNPLHAWLVFLSPDLTQASTSDYLGSFELVP